MENKRKNVLIAAIGGASLGTELLKSLECSGKYNVFGADISPYAYGLYEKGFVKTHVVNKENYAKNILEICIKDGIDVIVPGSDQSAVLIGKERMMFEREGVKLAVNSEEVVDLCSDKIKTFDYLENKGVLVPKTKLIDSIDDMKGFNYPCIIKPSTGTGGSVFVCLAEDFEEASFYVHYLKKRGVKTIVQEYVSDADGEYTVGVLSSPAGELIGSIALKRIFNCKLSYQIKYDDRVVSSGYSQGFIDDFENIRKQAEGIALKVGSRGPLNVQGRVKDGVFYPFEINPRFSASTYLRTMAGVNEVDIFLKCLFEGECSFPKNIKYGYYLRSFEEKYISNDQIRHG